MSRPTRSYARFWPGICLQSRPSWTVFFFCLLLFTGRVTRRENSSPAGKCEYLARKVRKFFARGESLLRTASSSSSSASSPLSLTSSSSPSRFERINHNSNNDHNAVILGRSIHCVSRSKENVTYKQHWQFLRQKRIAIYWLIIHDFRQIAGKENKILQLQGDLLAEKEHHAQRVQQVSGPPSTPLI